MRFINKNKFRLDHFVIRMTWILKKNGKHFNKPVKVQKKKKLHH